MTGGIQEQLPKIIVKPRSLEGGSVGEISMSGLNLVLPKGEGNPGCFILCLVCILEIFTNWFPQGWRDGLVLKTWVQHPHTDETSVSLFQILETVASLVLRDSFPLSSTSQRHMFTALP